MQRHHQVAWCKTHCETCIEGCAQPMRVCQAWIQLAIQHSFVHIMIEELDASKQAAGFHCELLHLCLGSFVLSLPQLYQTCPSLSDVLLHSTHGISTLYQQTQQSRPLVAQ